MTRPPGELAGSHSRRGGGDLCADSRGSSDEFIDKWARQTSRLGTTLIGSLIRQSEVNVSNLNRSCDLKAVNLHYDRLNPIRLRYSFGNTLCYCVMLHTAMLYKQKEG